MFTHIENLGELLTALQSLTPEQLNDPIRVSSDDMAIKEIGAIEISSEDIIRTDYGLEKKSAYKDSEIEENEYPTAYKAGTVFLDMKP